MYLILYIIVINSISPLGPTLLIDTSIISKNRQKLLARPRDHKNVDLY